jgi:hypothetical protein
MSKVTIYQIVSVFETGKALGDYSTASVLRDRAGITYGRHQATAKSGLLALILERYCALCGPSGPSVNAAKALVVRLPETVGVVPTAIPSWVEDAMSFLRALGTTPEMQRAQEQIFDEQIWIPSRKYADEIELKHWLSVLAIYDCAVQSGLKRVGILRGRFREVPPSKGGKEEAWTEAFLKARRDWLANYIDSDPETQALVRRTVYRVDAQLDLLRTGNWGLVLPIKMRGVWIR